MTLIYAYTYAGEAMELGLSNPDCGVEKLNIHD